ncbi:MAG TPA: hypothetical protein VIF62_30730 [Labilithrix sp.]
MQGNWLRGGVLVVGAAAIIGCAVGSAADDTDTSNLATTPIDGGDVDAPPSETLMPPAPPPAPVDDDAGTGDPDSGAGADSGGGGGDAGGGGGGGGMSCNAPNTCPTSTNLGSISGDTGSDTQTAQGTTSQWFTVRVNENDSSVIANSLEMKATLVSPAGANFDLYVYVPGSDTLECSAVSASSTSTSSTDTAGVEFGESGTFSDGSDNSRTVTVEVRHVSGSCSAGAKWTLSLVGNQH